MSRNEWDSNAYFNGQIDDLRITKGIARDISELPTSAFPNVETTDPFAANVVLFLKGDGTNGSTNIIDSSPSPKTISVFGNAQISTAQSKYGGSSLLFDGNGDYLSMSRNNVDLRTQPFTIEGWAYVTSTVNSRRLIFSSYNLPGDAQQDALFCGFMNENKLMLLDIAYGTFPVNQLFHFSFNRINANTYFVSVNGIGTTTTTAATSASSDPVFVGGSPGDNNIGSSWFNGYIDSFRITQGVARYTTNFNPETDTYLDISTNPTPTPTPNTINRCLATNGGIAAASSTFNGNFPASSTINGDRKGLNWANGGGWNSAGSLPASLEVAFSTAYSITKINVITLQDTYNTPVEPTTATTFSSFGVTSYSIEYWNGSAWIVIDSTTGNNKVYKEFTFSAVTTTKIRVYITASADGAARLVEVEAY